MKLKSEKTGFNWPSQLSVCLLFDRLEWIIYRVLLNGSSLESIVILVVVSVVGPHSFKFGRWMELHSFKFGYIVDRGRLCL